MIQTVHPTISKVANSPQLTFPLRRHPILSPAQSSNKLDASPTQFVGFANYVVGSMRRGLELIIKLPNQRVQHAQYPRTCM